MFRSFLGVTALALVLLVGAGAGVRAADDSIPGTANPAPDAEEGEFNLVTVAQPLSNPWSIDFLPDGSLIATERAGRLDIIKGPGAKPEPIEGLPKDIFVSGHGGLLEVRLDPKFAQNHTLYLSYFTGSKEASTIRVVRARLDDHKLVDVKPIYEAYPPAPGIENLGGRIVVDDKDHLFLTLGDRFDRARPQDLEQSWGKIIRINTDGTIPQDNPFIGVPAARHEIWAFGVRNPQGLSFDPVSHILWEDEHGPQGGDEVNIIQPGRNYGWPIITYGISYENQKIGIGDHAPGMEQPIYYFKPSIATSGLAVVRGKPELIWNNALWIGGLAGEILVRLDLEGDRVVSEHRYLEGKIGRIRDVRLGPDGFLYLATDLEDGGIYRLEPRNEASVGK
ncbi:PQQ-dependent sugar dehydrogenase [Segnochrobactrum spirostomi]|uniref:PQQ-dependent sugar dehydrogenase n=1 Tax=Segnochrobactrum spirostomi TaxID=2608987 RepID=A0A6A7XYD5_9HYPH|nr:PQQ-dependent sugar dehydrogenase [Segnochrobactrum spirostomi]MQT11413.1 PQQ-dependent sugar dehydrogenase [Segnochrobactrum spirostomi]